ncbi:MAG: histidinol dehydrogenase [Balneolales bacterium]|nr:histidinol dehydrogenase [Balneolales bacterium]
MRVFDFNQLSQEERHTLLLRPRIDYTALFGTVQDIINQVRDNGDRALLELTSRFDKATLDTPMLTVRDKDDIPLSQEVRDAFEKAFNNIYMFHRAQRPQEVTVETMPGVVCSRYPRAIPRVGLYVPGGTAVLPSSVLMLAIPAHLAGCEQVIIATPPRADGSLAPEVEFTAALCGVKQVLLAGGAQAVAALAYGTQTVPKVDKILGPGNQYVTAAKMLLQNSEAMISIDMPAGPSEVLVIADEQANPAFVAADLLSQAEHGVDSQVVLVTLPGFNTDALQAELTAQCKALPRGDIAAKALDNSYILHTASRQEALDFTNAYAPEHLIINTTDATDLVAHIQTAGSVFVGPWTPESVGDYASGTNHTLPTYGYARMYSGVSIDSYLRQMTVQTLTPDGLRNVGPAVEIMARTEGLAAHERAVSIRLKALKSS